MTETLTNYLGEISKTQASGIAREHAYRRFLQNLLHQILPEEIRATNEPARIDCGSPDYVLTKNNIPVGFIEAKDLGVDLTDKKHQEQLNRYRLALPNLIFTNYIDFHFYRDGELVTSVSIAKISDKKLIAITENFEQFEVLLKNFASHISQSIKSPRTLAQMMARKHIGWYSAGIKSSSEFRAKINTTQGAASVRAEIEKFYDFACQN